MAAPTRRVAPPAAAPPPVAEGVNFGSADIYAGGFSLPEGDWIITNPRVLMFQPSDKNTGQSRGVARLGVMIDFLDKNNPDPAIPHEQFYSMGTKAHLSFMPNETGTGILPVPNGSGNLPQSSNWAIFRQSLDDSGLPPGIFTNDISVLDGMWVHTAQIPEPEERKGFASATSEAADQIQNRGPRKIAVVTEILEGGMPWEGGGGIPEVTAATKPNGKAIAKPAPAARPAVAPRAAAPKPTPAPAAGPAETDLETEAINGISAALEASPNGMAKAALRPNTFKALKATVGEEVASQVIDAYFSDDATLNGILNQLSYGITAGKVVPL